MRKKIAIIGIILLVIGVAMLAVGVYGASGSITTISTFNQPNTGEYVSTQFAADSSETLVVSSPSSIGGLVPAQDVNTVSSTNINSYAASYNATAGGTEVYYGLSGTYCYVAFSSTSPNSTIIILNTAVATEYGVLAIGGIAFAIIGIIIAIVGAVLKVKKVENSGVSQN